MKREDIIKLAQMYAEYPWTASKENVFHGHDSKGVRVDTPDEAYKTSDGRSGWWKVGEENIGIPYKWGGFDSPESFDQGLAKGMYAGDMYSKEKRKLIGDGVSSFSVGIDCSGLICRCWGLNKKYSTRNINEISYILKPSVNLKPGDAMNKFNEIKTSSKEKLLPLTVTPPFELILTSLPSVD